MQRFSRISLVFLTFLMMGNAALHAETQLETTATGADMHEVVDAPLPEIAPMNLPKNDLATLYSLRHYKMAWNFMANPAAGTAFIDSLSHVVAYHGLGKDAYPFDTLHTLAASTDDKDHAKLDMLVTACLLRLAHDLHGDDVDLSHDYTGWTFKRSAVDIPTLLAAALASGSANEFVTGLAPKNPEYTKLASALRSYRAYDAKGGWGVIESGPPLRPQDNSRRVQQLRARLAAEDYLDPATPPGTLFDEALQKALTLYQLRNGLEPDGHVGEKTLDALNTPVKERIEQIRANMERWRHMPDDFPPQRYVRVNIADASVLIVEDGKEIYRGPVVVGKIDRETPFIQSTIRSMIVNPSWHVPIKIARKDILPKLRKDPHYLEKMGIVISGRANDPYGANIDWRAMKDIKFNFQLRQVPGEQNSLGHLKFDFENDFSVYMHGTPHQDLFDKPQRNFSSGCIRLRDPDEVGEILLKDTPGHWDIDKIDKEIDAGATKWVTLKKPMPIFVVYWSVFSDDTTGAMNFRKDVYDYDTIMQAGDASP